MPWQVSGKFNIYISRVLEIQVTMSTTIVREDHHPVHPMPGESYHLSHHRQNFTEATIANDNYPSPAEQIINTIFRTMVITFTDNFHHYQNDGGNHDQR
jgi:hypothetical protein